MKEKMDKFYSDYENRFYDVGKQIKSIAVRQAIYFMISCWIIGLIMIFQGDILILWGLVVVVLGTICSSLSTIILYGFGELIDKVSEISNTINNFNSTGGTDLKCNYSLNENINEIKISNKKSNETRNKIDKVLSNVENNNDNNNSGNKLDEDDLFIKHLIKVLLIFIGVIFFIWLINM